MARGGSLGLLPQASGSRGIGSRSANVTNGVNEERPNICVLIDFENMAVSAEQVEQEFDLTPVMELLKTRGRLVIKRAYGDWARYRHFRADLLDHAVDLVQLSRFGSAGKNRADIRRSEEHTSELQSLTNLVCRLLLEKKKK